MARLESVASSVAQTLVVSAPGYVEQTVTVSVGPLETKVVDVVLEPAKAAPRPTHAAVPAWVAPATPPGKLHVGASNGWCNVTVDGTPRGATPVAGIELPAGVHRVTCTTADGKVTSASVTVQGDGAVTRYKFAL